MCFCTERTTQSNYLGRDAEAYSKHFCVVQYVNTLREDAAQSHCSVQILKCTAALIKNH